MGCYDVAPYTCSYDSGGNGSLPGGGNPDYSALNTWEAASDNDLSGYSGPVILDCYDSQDHDNPMLLSGATNVSTTIYREIKSASGCAAPFAGKFGTGANFVGGDVSIVLAESYSRVRDLAMHRQVNSAGESYPLLLGSTGDYQKAINIVAKGTNAGSGDAYAFYGHYGGARLFYNCIALDSKTDGFYLRSLTGTTNLAVNCTAIGNGGKGFNAVASSATIIAFNCYAANNTGGDFTESNWDSPSGWNASKDNTADLGGAATYYKNGLDLIASGDLDSDGLATADDLYDSSAASSSYGRNPYDDLSSVIDFDNFLKNDTDGEAISKKDIRGTDRPTPDTADCAWNVGSSQMLAAPPATTSQPMFFIF